ncbi:MULTISPECIES: DinB family protein [Pseudomonas]|nr:MULTISPECIES: DinB family protein [Pseudomonas]
MSSLPLLRRLFSYQEWANGELLKKMSREEMLTHVVTHGGYHRGEVG